jgi:hypothetical protein
LEYHIDNRVILSEDTKFKNLYQWCLQEHDDEGNEVGRNQIPWEWTLYFTATELIFEDRITIDSSVLQGEDKPTKPARMQQSIRAKLRPGHPQEGEFDKVRFSMLGTQRLIRVFELHILKLPDTELQERCEVLSSVSHSFELDFRDETTDDNVVFILFVRPDTFARYSQAIIAGEVDEAILSVSSVEGFYADWSPSISTNSIKVLTNHSEHKVEMPDNCAIVPPRVGKVGDVSLNLYRIAKLEAGLRSEDTGEIWQNIAKVAETQRFDATQASHNLAKVNGQVVELLASLKMAAWVIAALLFLTLLI